MILVKFRGFLILTHTINPPLRNPPPHPLPSPCPATMFTHHRFLLPEQNKAPYLILAYVDFQKAIFQPPPPPPPRSKFSTDLDLIWIFWDWKTRTCAYNRKTLIPALFYVYCGGSQSIVETSYNHCLQKLPIRIRYELLLGFRTSTWYM